MSATLPAAGNGTRATIYAIDRKQFKQESALLDGYLKKKFCEIDREQLYEYMCSDTLHLPPYHGVLEAHRKWIIDEILTAATIEQRALAIKRFLKLAQYFFTEGNFSAFYIILSALDEKAIYRLRKSWDQVHIKYVKWYLEQVKIYLSGDYSQLLKIMNERKQLYFPYLLAIKKEYQSVLTTLEKKLEELKNCLPAESATLMAETSELKEEKDRILHTLFEIHSKLAQQVLSQKEEDQAFFVSRIKVWLMQEMKELDNTFIERSLLLE